MLLLEFAIDSKSLSIMFMSLDADPSVKSKAGFTPLHMAAQEGHEDCVEMLIERGADVNVPANNGIYDR